MDPQKGSCHLFCAAFSAPRALMSSKEIGLVFAFSTMLVLLVSFFSSWYYLIKTTLNRKPGVPFSEGGQSPNNIVFRPHQLTKAGLDARKKFIIWISVFLGTLLLSCVVLPLLSIVLG
jgi:hypothetical protein